MFQQFDREPIIFDKSQIEKHLVRRLRYPPATIKILIVADGSITYGASGNGFTLKKVLEVLSNDEHQDFPAYATFDVTTAHRNVNLSADISEFEFSANSLSGFDQIWLFGINRGIRRAIAGQPGKFEYKTYLESSELKAIADFMEAVSYTHLTLPTIYSV